MGATIRRFDDDVDSNIRRSDDLTIRQLDDDDDGHEYDDDSTIRR